MSLNLTMAGHRTVRKKGIERTETGDYILSDQGSWNTCVLHSIAKVIVFQKDDVLREPDFINLTDILLILGQHVSADTINQGMWPLGLHGKVLNFPAEADVDAPQQNMFTIALDITEVNCDDIGVGIEGAMQFIAVVKACDIDGVEEEVDELHALHVVEVQEERLLMANSWGTQLQRVEVAKEKIQNIFRVRCTFEKIYNYV